MRRALAILAASFALSACGSGKSSSDGAAGASGSGGVAGTGGMGGGGTGGGNPACANAVATQPCTAEGTFCGGDSCTNVCQFCNIVQCMNGVWRQMEVAPLPCFSCGPDLTCRSRTEYCAIASGGPPPGSTSYRCVAVPAACMSPPTCACLVPLLVQGGEVCAQAGTGELTVTIQVP